GAMTLHRFVQPVQHHDPPQWIGKGGDQKAMKAPSVGSGNGAGRVAPYSVRDQPLVGESLVRICGGAIQVYDSNQVIQRTVSHHALPAGGFSTPLSSASPARLSTPASSAEVSSRGTRNSALSAGTVQGPSGRSVSGGVPSPP